MKIYICFQEGVCKMYKIFIVDDQTLLRNGLEIIINKEQDMKVSGTAGNGAEAFEKIKESIPDVVLMDIRMPIMDGIECTKLLRNHYPEMIILILTTFNEEDYIIEGLANGANGFLLKGIDFQQLVQSIRQAIKGQLMLPAEVAQKLALRLKTSSSKSPQKQFEDVLEQFERSSNTPFTLREKEIMQYLIEGYPNKKISETIFISEGTVKNYVSDIYRKLDVKNRSEAIQFLKQLLNEKNT